jgi:hypothetical protein
LEVREDCIYNRAERAKVETTNLALVYFYLGFVCLHVLSGFGPEAIRRLQDQLFVFAASLSVPILIAHMRRVSARKVHFGQSLRQQLSDKYSLDLLDAFHVGVSPGRESRTYAGDCSWDVGYVVFDGGLRFYGDQCDFFVTRDQVISVTVIDRLILPRLLVQFKDPRYDTPRHMRLEIRDVEHNYEKLARAKLMKCEIEQLRPTGHLADVSLPLGDSFA